MSTPIATQAIDQYGLASARQLAFQSVLPATSANSASPLDNASSIVQVSALGQVLGAGATLQNSLEALQTNATNATPDTVQTTAQAFVTAFNNVQQSLAAALPLVQTLPDDAPVTQFAQTLDALAASSSTTGKQDASDLQAIGVSFLMASSPDSIETTARLSIDQNVLNGAAEANPAATATRLSDATESLLQQVTTFEVQATSSTVTPVLSAGVQLDASVIDTTLLAATPPGNTIITTNLAAVADVTPVAADTQARSKVATSEAPAATAMTTTTTKQSLPQTPAVATVDAFSADQAAADATHALQVTMADSALRDVIFNPAYSALIASSHLPDFTVPFARTRTGAIPAEIPGAVLPINRIGAIRGDQGAASAFVGR